MRMGWLLISMAGLAGGCGRMDFGAIDLSLEAKLITGVYTADAKLCLSRAATIKYALTTAPWPEDWTVEDLEQRGGEASVLSAGTKRGDAGCTVVTVKVSEAEAPVYLYAMAGELDAGLDEEMTLASEATGKMNPVFQIKTFTATGPDEPLLGKDYTARYWVHFPEAYYRDPTEPLPTLLFLHGNGSNGNNTGSTINRVLEEEPLKLYLQRNAEMAELPFLFYAPQCNNDRGSCFGWGDETKMPFLDKALEDLRTFATVDEARFYVTGSSTGGEGSWRYAIHRPELVDAVVPVAGTYSSGAPREGFYDNEMCKMAGIPVWAIHNGNDRSQLPSNARTLKAKLDTCGASTVQLDLGNWVYPPNDHAGWIEAYGGKHGFTNGGESSIYKWMLRQAK